MRLLVLFALYLLTTSFKTEGNIWYQTYIGNETGAFNIYSRGKFGFTFVGFSSQFFQNFSIVLYTENNKIKLLHSSNTNLKLPLTQNTNQTVNLLSVNTLKTFGNAFNDVEATFTFPKEYLDNTTILTLGNF